MAEGEITVDVARFPWLIAINRWLQSGPARVALAAIVGVVYLYAYWLHPARPGSVAADPLGWWGWWDQSHYLKSAATLAAGHLTAESYWYPLGYPLLGALFYRLAPEHPFLIPDLVLVVGSAILFYRVACKLVSSIEAFLLLAVFAISYRGTAGLSLVEPWNTIPTTFLSYLIIYLVLAAKPTRSAVLWASTCVGLIYLCRPPDAACLALTLPFLVFRIKDNWRNRVISGMLGAVIVLGVAGGVALINRAVFGSWRTPYEVNSANIGFGSYPLSEKAFSLVVDARPVFHLDSTALLKHFPWLVLLPPGLVYFIRVYKWTAVAVLSSVAATCLIYFAYNDFWPGNIFRYHLIHYLFWTFPFLALLVYIGLTRAWRDWIGRGSMALILPLLLVSCLLGLRETASARILPGTFSDVKIIPPTGSKMDWILLEDGTPNADPFGSELGLKAFRDFVAIGRDNGYMMILSSQARDRSVSIVGGETAWKAITPGTLEWCLQWPPRGLERFTLWLSSSPKITVRGTIDGIDAVGPAGEPDGRPDEILALELDRSKWQRISNWDVQTSDGRGHWVTQENSQGWWRIRVTADPNAAGKKVQIRLVFPDYGDFAAAKAFTLRALDADGNLVLEEKVPK